MHKSCPGVHSWTPQAASPATTTGHEDLQSSVYLWLIVLGPSHQRRHGTPVAGSPATLLANPTFNCAIKNHCHGEAPPQSPATLCRTAHLGNSLPNFPWAGSPAQASWPMFGGACEIQPSPWESENCTFEQVGKPNRAELMKQPGQRKPSLG